MSVPAIPWQPFDGCAIGGEAGQAVDAFDATAVVSRALTDADQWVRVQGIERAWMFKGDGWLATVILDKGGRLANFTWRAE